MNLRAEKPVDPEVNLTSLIDVVLLLLVFFMVTTSFVREAEIAIRLPEGGEEGSASPASEGVEVSVTAQGRYLINGRGLVDSRSDTLRAALRRVKDEAIDDQLVIYADGNASHQAVVTVMDAAARTGYVDVRIVTDPGSDGEQ